MDARQASPSKRAKKVRFTPERGPASAQMSAAVTGPPAAEMDVRESNELLPLPHLCENLPTGKSLLIFRSRVKPRNQKYSAFHVGQINGISPAIPGPHEGRFAIVTKRRAWDVMDASASGVR
jgi:hypothetical protein